MDTSPNMAGCHVFCRTCGYALVGSPSNRCPECGREFDPANPRTFLAHPRQSVLRRIVKIAFVLFCLTLPLDGYVGYLAWQVHRESKAIQILKANGARVTTYDTTPSWAKDRFHGHADWLWQRAMEVETYPRTKNAAQSIAALANLKSLRALDLRGWGKAVTDNDLAQLKGLTSLQYLNLNGTQVTDAGLEQLKNFTTLVNLYLDHTQVTDAGMAELQLALPACEIIYSSSSGRREFSRIHH
jgi:hypothetical protein